MIADVVQRWYSMSPLPLDCQPLGLAHDDVGKIPMNQVRDLPLTKCAQLQARAPQPCAGALRRPSPLKALSLLAAMTFTLPSLAAPVFISTFEGDDQPKQPWALMAGCNIQPAQARSGQSALHCQLGETSLVSRQPIAELGVLELWLKPASKDSSYRVNILTSANVSAGASWQQVGLLDIAAGNSDYVAYRISIDDPGRKYLRLDIDSQHAGILLDDISVERIALDTALQKNEQKIITGILDKLKSNKNAEVQAESFRVLGNNYAAQLEQQRQYLEYANAIYASVTLVLATSERNKMSNPMAYASFRTIIADTKRVASPLQQARLGSMVKPFGDLVTATLNVVSAGTYAAFAEPFKSFLAATFDRSNYENADLSRKDRKFAEENGLKIYQRAESFLQELERELQQVNALDSDLQQIQRSVDSFRKDLDKHTRDYLQHAGQARTQENFSKVMSKEEPNRQAIAAAVASHITTKATALQQSENTTELVQYMLKTSEQLERMQEFKERFNLITAAVLTFYDKFERSIAPDQNPFSDANDKKAWEQHAQKARTYIKQSKDAFSKAYL